MGRPHDDQVLTEAESRSALIAEWKHVTEEVLPALAKQHRWPLRLDHCFKRVCLDHAFGDTWYQHVRRPAEKHIEIDALKRAVQCARDIASEGAPVLQQRNRQSLRYRGKAHRAAQPSA